MSVGQIAPTIKAARNGEPTIAAFMGGQGAKARSIAYCEDGSTPTLKSAPSGGNTVPDVVYAVDGNVVDREAQQNGFGLSEDVAPSLNTQDKHAVCYPDKARSLCARHDSSPCVDRGQNIVCYDTRGNGGGVTVPTITGDHQNRVTDYTAIVVHEEAYG